MRNIQMRKITALLTAILLVLQIVLPELSCVLAISSTGSGSTDVFDLYDFSLWVEGQELDETADATQIVVQDGDEVISTFSWKITNNVLDGSGEKQLEYSYDLNAVGLTLNDSYNDADDSNAVYSENERIGYYTIVDNVFTIYLNENATENKSDISGGAIIEGIISLDPDDLLEDNSEQILGIGDKTYNVTYDSGSTQGSVTITKTAVGSVTEVEEDVYTQEYKIAVTIKGKISNITVEDILPDGLEYVENTLSASTGADATYQNGTISATLPDSTLKNSSNTYTITYTAKLTDTAVENGEKITNTATVYYTTTDGEDTSANATATITPPSEEGNVTITKTAVGDISYHPADNDDTENYYYQDYSVQVTVIGRVSNITLTDPLADELTLIESTLEVNNNNAKATYQNETIIVTIPDGEKNKKTTYTITYRAKVDDDVIENLTSVTNTATVTYTNLEDNEEEKKATATIKPSGPSISKSGSYAGTSVLNPSRYDAFDWTITVDFGTKGLTLSESEIKAIIATIVDTSYYNSSETNTISVLAPYGASDSPYTSEGYSETAYKLFFSGDLSISDFVSNSDGTYTLYYSTSYDLTAIGQWGVDINYFFNKVEMEIYGKTYMDIETVVYYLDPVDVIIVDKESSLDPYNQSSENKSVNFTNEDVKMTTSESEIKYDATYGYYKEYTITVVTPENIPVSNIVVSSALDSRLNYVPGASSTSVTKNGTANSLYFYENESSSYMPYYVETMSTVGFTSNRTSLDITLFGEANATYVITYVASIIDYEATNDYNDLENTITIDYDLELPYTISLDITNVKTDVDNVDSIIISDTLTSNDGINNGTTYFIDSDETFTITSSNLSGILFGGTWKGVNYSEEKYASLREFLRNFSVSIGDSTVIGNFSGTSSNYGGTSLSGLFSFASSLTVSRYSWTLVLSDNVLNYYYNNQYNIRYDGIIKVSYNAVQNITSRAVYQNKATATITVNGSTYTKNDYVYLTTGGLGQFSTYKGYKDSLKLGSTTYTYTDDNKIGWYVQYYNYSTGMNYYGDTITITDTLADNLSYVEGQYVAYFSPNSTITTSSMIYAIFSDEYGTITEDYDEQTNTVTFTINITSTSVPYSYLYIYFQTEIDEDYYEQMVKNGDTYKFTNSATVDRNGTSQTTNSATKSINTTDGTPITKESFLSTDYTSSTITANFTITANSTSQNYVIDSDTLTIVDEMPSTFVLDESSVQAINVDTGEAIEIETVYDKRENKIYFTVPDETYVAITYSVTIDVNRLENPFWYMDTTNIATISGGVYDGSKASSITATEDNFVKVWATSKVGKITIQKYWNDEGTMTVLTGATFTLYSIYDNMGHDTVEEMGSATVDENGKITFTNLPLDRIYKLVETGTPENYLTADDYYFILTGHNGVTIPNTLQEYTINTYKTGSTINIENYKYISVEVDKVWSEDSDFATEYQPESIKITLYRYTSEKETKELIGQYDVTSENDWKLTINNLRAYDDNGNTYTYLVRENDVAGYSKKIAVTESEDGNTQIFTITNTFVTTEINGTKTWQNDETDSRPDSIGITLYADGEEYAYAYNVTWSNTDTAVWSYEIDNLPVYGVNGEKIVYTVVENSVEGYSTTYSEDTLDITNTYITEEPAEEEPKAEETTEVTTPKTGDEVIKFVLIGIIAIIALILIIILRSNTKEENKNKSQR